MRFSFVIFTALFIGKGLTEGVVNYVDQMTAIRMSGDITPFNSFLEIAIKYVQPNITKIEIAEVDSDIPSLGITLNLTNITIPEIEFYFDKEFGFQPTDMNRFTLVLAPLDVKIHATHDITFTKLKKDFQGQMTVTFENLALVFYMNTISNNGTDVSVKIDQIDSSWDEFNIDWTNPAIEITWNIIFKTDSAKKQLINGILLPEIKDFLESIDFSNIINQNVIGTKGNFTVQIGLDKPVVFPIFDQGLPRGVDAYLDARIFLNEGGEKAPGVFTPDMNKPTNGNTFQTLSISANVVNNVLWGMYETKYFDSEINQQNLTDSKIELISLDTYALTMIFPKISDSYPTRSSVIIRLSTPDYSLDSVSWRNIQGRYGVLLSFIIELWVYKDNVDPVMNLHKCGSACELVVVLKAKSSATIAIQAAEFAKIVFSYFNLDVNSIEIINSLFTIDVDNLMMIVNNIVDLSTPRILPSIHLDILDKFNVTIDNKDDQRTFIELSNLN